ncbi:hypothetical protein GY45DRAFT_1274385 [Cubamyces sp. BRFM 1775]|nr:hypothetical protein GY45DRAFT_1274385 [Cubamyces sp. BRFM 1775]
MSTTKDAATPYAASCNPPRRAKRHRTSSLVQAEGPSPPSAPLDKAVQRRVARPPILPKQPVEKEYHIPPSPESDSASEEEDEYEPGREVAPAPKRRGRKPGTMSRSARESLRKLNHSKIEKARRTKINETLATLSMLVNDRERVLPSAGAAAVATEEAKTEETKGKKGKGKTEEKEFKLDVLVKTVEFMQGLIDRVKALEGATCSQCRTAHRPRPAVAEHSQQPKEPLKRKRTDDADESQRTAKHKRPPTRQEEDDSYVGDDEQGLGNAGEDEQPSPLPFAVNKPSSASPIIPTTTTSSPRLPPIASWLPHPYVDPSSLMSGSPSSGPTRSPTNIQLPSPPSSGRFRPTATLANMPALTLPGPAHPLTIPSDVIQKSHAQGHATTLPPRQQRKSVSASPSVSPTWTPEDETAATLLLHMSSKPSSAASSRSPPVLPGPLGLSTPREEVPGAGGRERAGGVSSRVPVHFEAATPSSILGMRD